MIKNVAIGVLLIVVIIESGLLLKHSSSPSQLAMTPQASNKSTLPPAGPNALRRGGPPVIMSKGMNLLTSPLFKYAYQIAPGAVSTDSQKALTGWSVDSKTAADGSVVVSLTPKDSDDQSQTYTIKSGEKLYFIEQTPADDKVDQDKDLNYRDDYGIIVDQSGIIQ